MRDGRADAGLVVRDNQTRFDNLDPAAEAPILLLANPSREIAMTGLQESVIYMHALLFLLSSGITLLADGHVRVDIVYSKMTERGKAWTDLIGVYLALIPMGWLILVMSSPYVNASWRILERSRESDGLEFVFLLIAAIPLFAVMMILQGASMAARAALTISGRPVPGHPKPVEGEL